MNEISIPTRTSRDIVTLPTVPEHYIEMGIALPSIAQASPAVKKFISYAVESGICKATPDVYKRQSVDHPPNGRNIGQ